MDRPDEEPPAKTCRLNSPELPQGDLPSLFLRLPLPPPQQRPRLREETEAAQVLADMSGGRLGPTLPPLPPYVILEEGGIRAYFTLGAGPGWEPAIESGHGGAPLPTGNLETLSACEVSGGSMETGFQVAGPSSLAREKVRETCSSGGQWSQRLAGPQRKEDTAIIVKQENEDEKKGEKRRRRRRKQRKVKKESKERNVERMEYILQALESIQLDLEAVNIEAGKAFLRLKRKFIQMRRPFLERRDLIIQHIPGFWVNAFLNHPKISILINQRDEDIFRYLVNLQVQDLRHVSMGYKMKLYFQTNPYFTNMVIVKEFQHNRSGRLVSHSTPIHWHRGQEPQAHRHKNQNTNHSFFNWFLSHSLPEADRIAEIIKNDLWVNPLRYYMMGEGGYRANRKKQEEERNPSDKCEVLVLEDSDDHQAVNDIISKTSDSDGISDNETIYDIKISDFMETTDDIETTDNEITDIIESLCDSDSPDHSKSSDSETTDNSENASDKSPGGNSENPDNNKNASENLDDNNESPDNSDEYADGDSNKNLSGDNENPEDGNQSNSSNNQGSSDSDSEGEGSDDEDNDCNEGDSDGSDDDGNEGDNEGSDDDDGDIEGYEKDSADPDKDQDNSNNQNDNEDEVEDISEGESEEEEEGNEEDEETGCDQEVGEPGHEILHSMPSPPRSGNEQEEDSDDQTGGEDSDMEEMLQAQNSWVNLGKWGKTR